MKEAQASANNETKSSAGDKYETGRAMSQNEKDINARHLADLLKMKKAMDLIDSSKELEEVGLGAVVKTGDQHYFISVGLGLVKVGDVAVFTISAVSPIGQQMIGLKKGGQFQWKGTDMEISMVF